MATDTHPNNHNIPHLRWAIKHLRQYHILLLAVTTVGLDAMEVVQDAMAEVAKADTDCKAIYYCFKVLFSGGGCHGGYGGCHGRHGGCRRF